MEARHDALRTYKIRVFCSLTLILEQSEFCAGKVIAWHNEMIQDDTNFLKVQRWFTNSTKLIGTYWSLHVWKRMISKLWTPLLFKCEILLICFGYQDDDSRSIIKRCNHNFFCSFCDGPVYILRCVFILLTIKCKISFFRLLFYSARHFHKRGHQGGVLSI